MGENITILGQLAQSERAFPAAQRHPARSQTNLQQLCNDVLNHITTAKIMRVALRPPPISGYFPHRTDSTHFLYQYEPSHWWTSGFFPGSIWLLYERSLRVNLSFSSEEILAQALNWQRDMEKEQFNKETHDLGFMILPAFYRHYKHFQSTTSKDIIINAGRSLASRWSEKVQCLRSWDECLTKRFSFENPNDDFLVIIDNMMNLDLLYICAELTGDDEYRRIATAHAHTTLQNHLRADSSTYHLVNYNPETGEVKGRYTVQGYDDHSCWSRGQAWALYGYATVYMYTKDEKFLDAANNCTRYFCSRIGNTHGAVFWDFDAPRPPVILDTSAATIACSGILLLYQLTGDNQYLPWVMQMMRYCLSQTLAPDGGDTVLKDATVNNNKDAIEPSSQTGLVYADYYLLEAGNRLLEIDAMQ
ncbi:glycoside hydrolase family 88 protein [Trichoderma barbatum]